MLTLCYFTTAFAWRHTPCTFLTIVNSRLVEIMYDIQEYGQPPADIIKELAPGLDFNEEGLPMMANMGGNMFPHMPNVPFPDVEKCNIM